MGAVTIANRAFGGPGTRRAGRQFVEADITPSTSYSTGGDTLAVTSLPFRRVTAVEEISHDSKTRKPVADAASRTGLSVQLGGTQTAPTLRFYDAVGVEVTAATNLASRGPFRLRIIGY